MIIYYWFYLTGKMCLTLLLIRGRGGGVPWVRIMENELECLGDRRGHDATVIPSQSYRGYRVMIWLSLLSNSLQ